MFKFTAAIFFALFCTGCLVPLSLPTLEVTTTGFPSWGSRNQVVVTCPSHGVSIMKVEKIDQFGKSSWAVKPGESIGVRASGLYNDQAMVVVVYGYKRSGTNARGEATYSLVGRTSRDFRFYDSGNNSGQLITWDIQISELR